MREASRLLRNEVLGGLAALWLCELGSCAQEREYDHPDDEIRAGHDQEGGQEDQDDEAADEASTAEPTLRALMNELLAEYARDVVARCPCYVSEGIYSSMSECTEATVRSRPAFDDCLDRTVPEAFLADLRDWASCLTDAERAHNLCLEEAATCDAQMECRNDGRRCGFPDAVRLQGTLEQCPHALIR